jgi:hypothetical protein
MGAFYTEPPIACNTYHPGGQRINFAFILQAKNDTPTFSGALDED